MANRVEQRGGIEFGPLLTTEEFVRQEARRQGLDPDLAAAIARQESGFRQEAVSPKGAVGTMQLMPQTAAELGVDPSIEAQNVQGGVTYLRQLLDRYQGDIPSAVAAYNAGPGRIDRGGPLPQETRAYVSKVLGSMPAEIDFGRLAPDPADHPANPLSQPPTLLRRIEDFATRGIGAEKWYEQKILPALQSILPADWRGSYAADLAAEVSKAGPAAVDFLTSPLGIGLVAAHLFPGTAPVAAIADIGLGGQQAVASIPDIIDAARNLDDPRKVGRAIVGLIGAYGGLKGGKEAFSALRRVPAGASGPIKFAKEWVSAIQKGPEEAQPAAEKREELIQKLSEAFPDERRAVIEEASTPTNVLGGLEQKLYRTPGVRAVANVLLPGVKQPPLLDLAQSLVDQRAANITKEFVRVQKLADEIERNVPEEEQNIRKLGYAMEESIPESSLSEQGQEALRKIRELNRITDKMREEAYGGKEIMLLDPNLYIRHYWDFEQPSGGKAMQYAQAARMTRLLREQSLRARTIPSLQFGIEVEGLKPRYEKVSDVIVRRHMEAAYAIENKKFIDTLRSYGLIIDPTHTNRELTGWKPAVDASALKLAFYGGKSSRGDTILREAPPLVHPDIEMAVNAIFGEPKHGFPWAALEQLRAFSKQLKVGFSLFHMNAVSEINQAQAIAAGGKESAKQAIRGALWPLDPEFWRGVRDSLWEVRGGKRGEPPYLRLSMSEIEPWIDANLNFFQQESEAAAIRRAMKFLEDKGPFLKAVGAPVRAAGKLQYVFNRALFDYYISGHMLHSAEHLLTSELNRLGPEATPEQVRELRREIADHVNRSYGAENMERLLLSPQARQALGLVLFAPVWTLSNLRVLTKGFETVSGSRITARYIGGAALTYFLSAQLANYAMSEWAAKHSQDPSAGAYWDEETQQWKRGGHWTWQNPGLPLRIYGKPIRGLSDNAANIYLGQNPDGSQRYIRLGKGFREPFLWLTSPLETLKGKLSMLVRQAIIQFSGVEPGSGYPIINPKLPEEKQIEQRISAIADLFVPFSMKSVLDQLERESDAGVFKQTGYDTQIYGMPARRGVSFYRAVESLREALDKNDMDAMRDILRTAALNRIDPKSLIRELRGRLRSEARTLAGEPAIQFPEVSDNNSSPPGEIEFGELRAMEQ
jgi:hypothetical protein